MSDTLSVTNQAQIGDEGETMVLWLKEGKEKNCENVNVIGSHTHNRTRFPGY